MIRLKTLVLLVSIISFSCSKSSDVSPIPSTGTTPGTTTGSTGTTTYTTSMDIFKKIYGASSITSDGTYVTIKTNGTPDHKSIYYASTNPLYETFSGKTFNNSTFQKNPNGITEKTYSFKIPINPKEASNKQATPLGPIGVSINGVPFYNQYAGPNQPLTGEVASFDQYWGHPAVGGTYHYHVEPIYLTTIKVSKSALLGFLLDGFPVYGPEENGASVVESKLDAYHGHTSMTTEYPAGIYHYHVTNADPYINGSGFFGTPGTVSQ